MSNLREFSLFGSSVNAVREIGDLQYDENKETIVSIKVMHSINLRSMQGVQLFTKLLELNLSNNAIEKIENLQPLTKLKVLNLSCNRIRKIEGLSTLNKLEKLVLASNKIDSLHPISQLGGDDYSLRNLDLKDNKLQNLSELQHLNCLVKLKEIHLALEDDKNPIFKDKAEYVKALAKQPISEQLQKIDGKPANIFFPSIGKSVSRLSKSSDIQDDDKENLKWQKSKRSSSNATVTPVKNKKSKDQIMNSPITSKRTSGTDRIIRASGEITLDPQQHRDSQDSQDQDFISLAVHKELQYKLECSEKFWGARVAKLEEDILNLSKENMEYREKNAQLVNGLNAKNQEIADLTNTISVLQAKKEKKEDVIEELQNRIGELMRENGNYHREINFQKSDTRRGSELMSTTITERKHPRYNHDPLYSKAETERDNNSKHQSNFWNKYEELERAYQERCREVSDLEIRNKEIVGLVKDWEERFKRRAEQEDLLIEQRVIEKEKDFQKRLAEASENSYRELGVQEEKFKETMDILESEFKNVLLQNNQKFNEFKAQYEEKARHERELQRIIESRGARIEDLEKKSKDDEAHIRTLELAIEQSENHNSKLIQELSEQRLLNRRKTELDEDAERLNDRKTSLKRLRDLEEELEAKNRELSQTRGLFKELESEIEVKDLTIKRLNNKFPKNSDLKQGESDLKIEIAELREMIGIKTRQLDEKDSDIKNLQNEIHNIKGELHNREHELSRSKERLIECRKLLNEELEEERNNNRKIQQDQEKLDDHLKQQESNLLRRKNEIEYHKQLNDDLRSELKDLKDSLRQLERENQELRESLNVAEKSVKEKEIKLADTENNLKDHRGTIQRHLNRIQNLEEEIRARDTDIEKTLKTRDKEIESLRKKLIVNQEEMKELVHEIDRQKLLAKENIEKLNQIFK